jgi:Flp pilus assembly protein TadG
MFLKQHFTTMRHNQPRTAFTSPVWQKTGEIHRFWCCAGSRKNAVTDKSMWLFILENLRRFARGDSGSAALLVAVSLVPIVGMMGFAIDMGQLRFAKQRLQMTADAAALAGALELNTCGATPDCSALETAAQNALTENGFTGSTLQGSCIPTGTGLAISVNNGPCALGSQNPHNGNTKYVEAVVSQTQSTYFAGLLGIRTVQIMARAEAGQIGGSNCMFALDPTGSGAISVDLLASVNSPCGIVDESSSNSALQCGLLASISASQIGVVGGVSTFLCGISPTPRTHIPVPNPADPLSYLPEPAVPSCGTSSAPSATHHGSNAVLNLTNTTTTLYADNAYCGGIIIGIGANVTFDTTFGSTFVLTSTNGGTSQLPGGLQINLGSTVTGNGVTFYNYGPSGGITFGFAGFTIGGVHLTAPTGGTYSGILFFQDNGNTSQATIAGSPAANTKLQGTYYFPSAKVVYALDGVVAYNILVAKDIEFALLTFAFGQTGGSQQFSNDYSSLANGSPLSGSGAVLVQ